MRSAAASHQLAAVLAAAAGVLLVVVALTANNSGHQSKLLSVRPMAFNQPRRISFLPMRFLDEMQYPPSYNNYKLRESGCFGFERNPGYESWTPDDHALWCQTAQDMRIGDPRMRDDESLRVGNLIGEGNALIDINEYNNADSSMGEAQREVVDRI